MTEEWAEHAAWWRTTVWLVVWPRLHGPHGQKPPDESSDLCICSAFCSRLPEWPLGEVIDASHDVPCDRPSGSGLHARHRSQGWMCAPMAAKPVRAGVHVCRNDGCHAPASGVRHDALCKGWQTSRSHLAVAVGDVNPSSRFWPVSTCVQSLRPRLDSFRVAVCRSRGVDPGRPTALM